MNKIVTWLKNIFFPPRCVLCDEVVAANTMPICPACAKKELPLMQSPVCNRCGREKKSCVCKMDTFLTDGIAAPFYNEQPIKDSIYYFKKAEDIDRIQYYTENMLASIYAAFADKVVDYITTVPMHYTDYATRGFDQTEPLAKYISKELHVPYVPLLRKIFPTPSQKSLPAHNRSGNVLGAFDVQTNVSLKGKSILLLDDVVTTGSTTNECAKMLKIYGAKHVYVAAVAVSRVDKQKNNEKENPIAQLKEKLGGKVGDFT